MIWDSISLMTIFDVAIFSLAVASLHRLLKHKKRLRESNLLRATATLATGLFLIGLFYFADLLIMWGLPLFTNTGTSMAVMESLHLNFSWINALVVTLCIFSGFSLLTQKTLGQSSELERLNFGLQSEIQDRKRVEKALEEHWSFEALLAKISSDFINLPARQIDKEINSALRLLGELMKVDRAYIAEFSEDQSLVSLKYEWTAPNVRPRSPAFQNLEIDLFPWMKGKRLRGDTIVIPSVDTLPDEAGPERNILEKSGTKSMVSVPLSVGGKVRGSVGFDSTTKERTWSDEQIQQLKLVGQIFANALTRKQNEEALLESEERFKKLSESTFEGIVIADKGRVVDANKQMAAMLGLQLGDLIGKSVFEFIAPESRKLVERNMKSGFEGPYEHLARKDDGTLFPVEVRAKMLPFRGKMIRVSAIRDITERKQAEIALQREKVFSERLINSSVDGILAFDSQCRYTVWNQGMERISGVSHTETLGKCAFDVFPFLKDIGEDKFFYDALAGKMAVAKDRPYIVPETGQEGFFEGHYSPLRDETGNIIGALAVIRETTARKLAEEALRQSEEKYRQIVETAQEGIWTIDAEAKTSFVNPKMADMLGYEIEEMLGAELFGFMDEEGKKISERSIERCKKGIQEIREFKFRHKNGAPLWALLATNPLVDKEGNYTGTLAMVTDITDRKEAEEKMNRYQDKLRALAAELSSAEEQERRRIAADLHDRIGQSLAISKMRLAELRQTVQSTEITSQFEEFQKALDQAIKDTRTLTYEISPPLLYELGFEEALEWLTEEFSNEHALEVKFSDDGKTKKLDEPMCIFLFRAVRELLVNIIKHAKAKSVAVTIRKNRKTVQLQVSDDGVGFDTSKPRSKMEQAGGFGLFNIRDRLDYYGGKLEIRSQQGQGTHVILSAPLKNSS
ncbi:MAG: PAS domain S-box protein [bacterium]